jgi:hypothetical protein
LNPYPPDDYLDPAQSVFPFRNFGISDVPYNWDYCFRAGIFCGDVWADTYRDSQDADGQDHPKPSDQNFWVTPCPIDED